jgi:hypothetical protein
MRNALIRCAVVVAVGLVVASGERTWAQTSTSRDVRSFEVISVTGNKLVVRESSGTREYSVPADFRFDIDGKQVPVSALRPGMKGTATFTTTTTSTPVYVTEIREAEVLQASENSLLVRGPDGFRMWSPGEVEKRGITIMKAGRPVEFSDIRKGDRLTATIVTEGPPRILTETQVKAVVEAPVEAVASGASAAAKAGTDAAAAARTAAADAAVATKTAASEAAEATKAAASEAAEAAQSAATGAEASSGLSLPVIVGIGIVLAALVWYAMTRRQRRT